MKSKIIIVTMCCKEKTKTYNEITRQHKRNTTILSTKKYYINDWNYPVHPLIWFRWPRLTKECTHDLKSLSCNYLDLNSSFHYPSSSQFGCYYSIRKHQWHPQTNDPKCNKTYMFWNFLSSNYSSWCMFLFSVSFEVSVDIENPNVP